MREPGKERSPIKRRKGLLQSAWKAILYLKRLTETRNARNGGVEKKERIFTYWDRLRETISDYTELYWSHFLSQQEDAAIFTPLAKLERPLRYKPLRVSIAHPFSCLAVPNLCCWLPSCGLVETCPTCWLRSAATELSFEFGLVDGLV
ncbi:hypothetical protein VNO77_46932 [Canavalia gladiata]|uniref:Uncharacterized protein n=1 Tax=Canavalia gladiata TaxID=3824 RepID=A0AAN9JI04_CANGL